MLGALNHAQGIHPGPASSSPCRVFLFAGKFESNALKFPQSPSELGFNLFVFVKLGRSSAGVGSCRSWCCHPKPVELLRS